MNILVTGNKGYIGTVLTQILLQKGYAVVGFDTGYYNDCQLLDNDFTIQQISKDIRNTTKEDLKDIDAIVHLAALSNDPLGEFDPKLTLQINYSSTIRLAKLAKELGIKRFIYSSSQSMYGISKIDEELEEDNSFKNPLTAYAKTKWEAECELKKLNSDDFTVVCFRPSTVFGVSPNFRTDIVFNNLVASAYATGKIEIKSDGTPWRPVVHIKDVCQAFIAGLEAPVALVTGQSFNVGIKNGNFTVKELAMAAQRAVEGSSLVFTGEHGLDSRTYKVSFKKIFKVLSDYYKPEFNLDNGSREMIDFFKKINFTQEMFRGRQCNRLAQLKYLVENKKLSKNLTWQ